MQSVADFFSGNLAPDRTAPVSGACVIGISLGLHVASQKGLYITAIPPTIKDKTDIKYRISWARSWLL